MRPRDRLRFALRARVVAAALGLLVAACGGGDDVSRFNAVLLGSNEVPPVTSASTALYGFEVKENDTVIFYRGSIIGLDRDEIVGANVYLGEPGENGPILFALDAPLVDDVTEFDVEGVLLAEDLAPDSGLATFQDAVAAIRAGRAYVSVQTTGNPTGEIRGAIVKGAPSRRGLSGIPSF
ncbi:MAG TPA: CHRD domain-containing protein [Candidatus Binatia bacterium]|nr:CHRD domain-containing protein [Candidatus Binatia bacterium]